MTLPFGRTCSSRKILKPPGSINQSKFTLISTGTLCQQLTGVFDTICNSLPRVGRGLRGSDSETPEFQYQPPAEAEIGITVAGGQIL